MTFEQQMLALEWTAAALGVLNIGFLIFRSVWNYPFAIAMVGLYIFVFWEERLYAEAGLQVFFILANLYGWWLWVRVGGEDNRVPVRWLDWRRASIHRSLSFGGRLPEKRNAIGISRLIQRLTLPPPCSLGTCQFSRKLSCRRSFVTIAILTCDSVRSSNSYSCAEWP